jgi:hypothetical protein
MVGVTRGYLKGVRCTKSVRVVFLFRHSPSSTLLVHSMYSPHKNSSRVMKGTLVLVPFGKSTLFSQIAPGNHHGPRGQNGLCPAMYEYFVVSKQDQNYAHMSKETKKLIL